MLAIDKTLLYLFVSFTTKLTRILVSPNFHANGKIYKKDGVHLKQLNTDYEVILYFF